MENLPKQEEVYNLSNKYKRRKPKKTDANWWMVEPPEKLATGPKKVPSTWGGVRKGAGRKKGTLKGVPRPAMPGAGRPKKYNGETTSVVFYTSKDLIERLKAEAARRNMSRNELFNDWLNSMPDVKDEDIIL